MSGDRAKGIYDAMVKEILSYKCILARIMKYTVTEMAGYSEDEIISFIEGTPAVAEEPLYEEAKSRVFGVDSVDTIDGEGTVTFDVVFTVRNRLIKLYVNVEAQNDSSSGYDLVTRAIYYCARLLSKQYGREFDGKHYDGIKKVYSIWICTNPSVRERDTITRYSVKPEFLFGKISERVRYDLLSVVMVCLKPGSANDLIRVLYTLFTNSASREEKRTIVATEFGEEVAKQMEGGIGVMCNLSDYIEEKGIAKGLEKGLEKGREEGLEKVANLYVKGYISYEVALEQVGDKKLLDKLIASQTACV